MQVDATIEGRRILWNHHTRVYDEKPTSMKASIKQKIRWGQGHWFVALTNTKRLFKAFFTGQIGFGEFLSLLTYMYSISTYVVVLIQTLISLAMVLISMKAPMFTFSVSSLLYGAAMFTLICTLCGERTTQCPVVRELSRSAFGVYIFHVAVLDILVNILLPDRKSVV